MYDLPRTPNTLPCDDEDQLFVFDDDGSANNNSVGEEVRMTKSPEACFLPMYNQSKSVNKKLDFDEALTERAQSKYVVSTKTSGNQTVYQVAKRKRKLFNRTLFSTSHLSNKIKNMKLSPVKSSSTLDKFGWHRNNIKIKKKSYQSLEEEESSSILPEAFVDDRSFSRQSYPSRFTKSLFWKKRSSPLSSASPSMTITSKVSKLKWNKTIQINYLSSSKPYPEVSPRFIPTTARAMEVVSSCSTASSSCPSIGEDKRSLYISLCLEPSPHQELEYMRVDEEDDEDYDSDPEDDMHPDAGSFACAVSRRCRASF